VNLDINEITYKFETIFIFIYILLFFLISLQILNFDNNKKYDYLIQLIDLGYKPKNYNYIKKSYDLQFSKNYLLVFNIGLGIISILTIAKWTFFGGFKNIIFIWICMIISFIIILLNIGVLVICVLGVVFSILAFSNDRNQEDIKFNNDTIFTQLIISYIIYITVLIFSLIEFIFNIQIFLLLNKIKNENQRLEIEKKSSENLFKFTSLKEQKNLILEAINDNPELPKYLFYQKKIDHNPPINFQNIMDSTNINLYIEQNEENFFDKKQKLELKNYKYKAFETKMIISKIIYFIIFSGISFISAIIAIVYSFHKNKYYKAYRDYFIYYYNVASTSSSLIENLYGYNKLWVDFGNYENDILISFLVFIILFILFEIFSLLIHKNIIGLDYKNGFFYNILLLSNMIFYILFKIYLPLLFFLFIFSILIIAKKPNYNDFLTEIETNNINYYYNNFVVLDKEWNDNKSINIVNIVFKLFLTLFTGILIFIKYSIIDYLNKNYEANEDEDENQENDEINEVKTSLILNNNKYETQIKLNHILYLQPINSISNDINKDVNNNIIKLNIFKFKKINIVNLTNSFVYVKLGLNSVTDQISLAEWNYPDINIIFSRLADMSNSIYIILFFSVPLFKMHVDDELLYYLIILANTPLNQNSNFKKAKFFSVYEDYGSYEKRFTKSRFILYLIQLIIILFFMLKRIFFGGFKEPSYLLFSYILCIICLIENIIYVLLDFLTILFTLFSIISLYDNENIKLYDEMLEVKFFVQLFINIIIFIFNIVLLKETVNLTLDYNKIRKDMNKFINKEDNIDENNPEFKPIEFKYISLEGKLCSIFEYRNTNLQRYLFYSTENTQGNIQENTQNNEVQLNLRENTQKNNQENTELNLKENIQKNNQENNELINQEKDQLNNQENKEINNQENTQENFIDKK
jgi:hypothetical protein